MASPSRPRALAVGERLWSSKETTNLGDAKMRLWEHRCRYVRYDVIIHLNHLFCAWPACLQSNSKYAFYRDSPTRYSRCMCQNALLICAKYKTTFQWFLEKLRKRCVTIFDSRLIIVKTILCDICF